MSTIIHLSSIECLITIWLDFVRVRMNCIKSLQGAGVLKVTWNNVSNFSNCMYWYLCMLFILCFTIPSTGFITLHVVHAYTCLCTLVAKVHLAIREIFVQQSGKYLEINLQNNLGKFSIIREIFKSVQ